MKMSPKIQSGPKGAGTSRPMKPLMHCSSPPADTCDAGAQLYAHRLVHRFVHRLMQAFLASQNHAAAWL